jgi:hypothetical protein
MKLPAKADCAQKVRPWRCDADRTSSPAALRAMQMTFEPQRAYLETE